MTIISSLKRKEPSSSISKSNQNTIGHEDHNLNKKVKLNGSLTPKTNKNLSDVADEESFRLTDVLPIDQAGVSTTHLKNMEKNPNIQIILSSQFKDNTPSIESDVFFNIEEIEEGNRQSKQMLE